MASPIRSGQRRSSKLGDLSIKQEPLFHQLYSPLQKAIERSIYTTNGSSLEGSKGVNATRRSLISHETLRLTPSKAMDMKESIIVPTDRTLVPSHNVEKFTDRRFKIVDVQEKLGEPISEQQFLSTVNQHKPNVERIVYELRNDPYNQNGNSDEVHNIYEPIESKKQILTQRDNGRTNHHMNGIQIKSLYGPVDSSRTTYQTNAKNDNQSQLFKTETARSEYGKYDTSTIATANLNNLYSPKVLNTQRSVETLWQPSEHFQVQPPKVNYSIGTTRPVIYTSPNKNFQSFNPPQTFVYPQPAPIIFSQVQPNIGFQVVQNVQRTQSPAPARISNFQQTNNSMGFGSFSIAKMTQKTSSQPTYQYQPPIEQRSNSRTRAEAPKPATVPSASPPEAYNFAPLVSHPSPKNQYRYNLYSSLDEAVDTKCSFGSCFPSNEVVAKDLGDLHKWR